MEIQDRNSLLALMFGLKDGVAQNPELNNDGFADILKSQRSEPLAGKDAVDVKADKLFDEKMPVKDSKDVPLNKDTKKELGKKENTVADKEKTSRPDKNKGKKEDVEVSSATNSPSETAAKDTSDAPKAEDSAAKTVESENTEDALVTENTESTTQSANIVTSPVKEAVVSVISSDVFAFADVLPMSDTALVKTPDVVSDVVAPLADSTVALPELQPVTEDAMFTEEVKTVSDTVKGAAENTVAEAVSQPASEEEILLMEQAKLLDDKIKSDKKLKVEVSVNEEKIAAAPTKDTLQNRFEIDSLFRSITEDNIQTTDVDADVETFVSAPQAQKQTTEMPMPLTGKAVAYNEVEIAKDIAVKSASAETIINNVTGKEFAGETINPVKGEAFARLNETSSRDVFKGMSKEVIEQVKVNITKSAIKGVDTIDIQLKPEDLGKIQIKMHISKDGRLQADIISSRPETLEILQKDLSNLTKAFNDAGFDTDSKSFNFSFQNENQAGKGQKDDSGLSRFIGETLEQEAENMAGNDNHGYDPVLGLNIRV